VQAKAAVELTVMAKACASKGRTEVAESTAKAIDALRGHVEVRSTSPDTINGTKQGTCSVTIVREARALARLAEPLIVLEPELANTPGMYVVLAQGCMFPHELIHQLAAASEYYAEKCALENSPGLPPLLFAYKKDTVRLQRQGIERGAAVIAFSYQKADMHTMLAALPAELKSLVRLVLDTDGQLVSIEVRMPEVKPWVPLRVMELKAEVKVCIYSPELAENEELFSTRAAQLLYAEAGLQGSFVAHRALKWGGGMGTIMVRVDCEAAVRQGLQQLYARVKTAGVLGRTIEGERFRVLFAHSLDTMVKNATALGLLKADSACHATLALGPRT
jgi:hypothetical protein